MSKECLLDEGIKIAFQEYRKEYGEDAKLAVGERFFTVFNDAIIDISMEFKDGCKNLVVEVLAGKPYFVDMDLNILESEETE